LFENHWDGFVDKSCQKETPKSAACLYGELGKYYLLTLVVIMP